MGGADAQTAAMVEMSEPKNLRAATELLRSAPTTWDECVRWAREKFQAYFHNAPRQLLHVYPVDAQVHGSVLLLLLLLCFLVCHPLQLLKSV